ncbi:hypothetical protein Q7P37_005728 [Cladosporium fusiforme]
MSIRRLASISAHLKTTRPNISAIPTLHFSNPLSNMAAHTNGASASHVASQPAPIPPKITLYTNHGCPYAHRAHIALAELNLPYSEVHIDLTVPRPQWYLDLNPRGLVPTVAYSVPGLSEKDEIITESGIVAQFLADAFPGPFLPASKESPTSALERARVNFFTDAWTSKVGAHLYPLFLSSDEDARAEVAAKMLAAVEKEIEPLLSNAAPFFNGSSEFTLAEAIVAPFVVRLYDASEDGVLAPKSLAQQLDALPNFGKWAKAVRTRPSVLAVYDAQKVLENTKVRLAKMAAEKK